MILWSELQIRPNDIYIAQYWFEIKKIIVFLVFPGNACILHTTNVFSYVNSDIIYRFALDFVIFTPLSIYSTSTIFVLLQVGGTTTNVVHL